MEVRTQKLYEQTFAERYFATVRKLGRVGLTGADTEYLKNLERRRYDELTSGLTEALLGVVRTEYSFELRNGHLVAEDGEPIENMLIRAHDNDLELAARDYFYAEFLPQRSRYELEELYEMEAMARGETDFNTIITFSPYSEEFDTSPQNHKKLKAAKQNPQWKRAMVRVSHWDGQKLQMITRSIDNSELDLLHETARRYLQYEFQAKNSTATLGERIHLKANSKMVTLMPDAIVRVADTILTERRGGTWYQGRSEQEARDLQHFVESNPLVVTRLLAVGRQLAYQYSNFESYKKALDNEIYNYTALLENRLERGASDEIIDIARASVTAGSLARAEGRSYDMCGYVLEPSSTEAQMAAKTGFESLMRLLGKEVECPACEKKVVVPARKLLEGRLACAKCGFEVDACTGKVYKKPKPKKQPFKFW